MSVMAAAAKQDWIKAEVKTETQSKMLSLTA